MSLLDRVQRLRDLAQDVRDLQHLLSWLPFINRGRLLTNVILAHLLGLLLGLWLWLLDLLQRDHLWLGIAGLGQLVDCVEERLHSLLLLVALH